MEPSTPAGQVEVWGTKLHTQEKRRRPKVPLEQRKRTSTACDHCRTRRVKCTGEHPCRQCELSKTPCIYPPNVQKIQVPETYIDSLQKQIAALEQCLQKAIPDEDQRREVFQQHDVKLKPSYPACGTSSAARSASLEAPLGTTPELISSPGSPERPVGEIELDIDYVGIEDYNHDSSTRFLLQALSELMETLNNQCPAFRAAVGTRYETLQFLLTLPLPYENQHSLPGQGQLYPLPPKSTLLHYVESFAKSFGPGRLGSFDISGGCFHWFSLTECLRDIEILYRSVPQGQPGASPNHRPALDPATLGSLYMAVVLGHQDEDREILLSQQAHQYPAGHAYGTNPQGVLGNYAAVLPIQPRVTHHTDADVAARLAYFEKAKALLGNPMDDISRPRLRLLYLLAFHCLSDARLLDAGYMYMGMAIRMAIVMGMHLAPDEAPQVGSPDPGEFARAAQTAIENEERKREFWNVYILDRAYCVVTGRPSMLQDDEVSVSMPSDLPMGSLPTGVGLAANAKLRRISGKLITTIYGKHRSKAADIARRMDHIHAALNEWNETLHPDMMLIGGMPRDRATGLLHILHNHMYIIASRPAFLLALRHRIGGRDISVQNAQSSQTSPSLHLRTCVTAAERILVMTRQMENAGWVVAHAVTDFHCQFDAVMVLVLAQTLPGLRMWGHVHGHRQLIDYAVEFLARLGNKGNVTCVSYANIAVELDTTVQRYVLLSENDGEVAMSSGPVVSPAGYP